VKFVEIRAIRGKKNKAQKNPKPQQKLEFGILNIEFYLVIQPN
jgi:hypothetical protein